MKKALIIAAALSLSAPTAFAGGMNDVADDTITVVPQETTKSATPWLPIAIGVLVIGAAVGGSGS